MFFDQNINCCGRSKPQLADLLLMLIKIQSIAAGKPAGQAPGHPYRGGNGNAASISGTVSFNGYSETVLSGLIKKGFFSRPDNGRRLLLDEIKRKEFIRDSKRSSIGINGFLSHRIHLVNGGSREISIHLSLALLVIWGTSWREESGLTFSWNGFNPLLLEELETDRSIGRFRNSRYLMLTESGYEKAKHLEILYTGLN